MTVLISFIFISYLKKKKNTSTTLAQNVFLFEGPYYKSRVWYHTQEPRTVK